MRVPSATCWGNSTTLQPADEGWIVCPRFCTWLSKTNNSTVVVMLETRWLCLSRKERNFLSTWEIRSIICWYYLLGWRSMIVATHFCTDLYQKLAKSLSQTQKLPTPTPHSPATRNLWCFLRGSGLTWLDQLRRAQNKKTVTWNRLIYTNCWLIFSSLK